MGRNESLPVPLELAIDFIADDEWIEITPNNIRLRKKVLLESQRKRARTQSG